jgi:hypothetical protein
MNKVQKPTNKKKLTETCRNANWTGLDLILGSETYVVTGVKTKGKAIPVTDREGP